MKMSVTVWESALADAVSRLEWVQSQTAAPERQALLLPMAGDGGELPDNVRTPETLRKERAAAVRKERAARMLAGRVGGRFAVRDEGRPFDPRHVGQREAESVLLNVGRYVDRWSGPNDAHPLSPEGRQEVRSAIVYHIWTRDYSDGSVRSLAQAVFQACKLFRRCGWRANPEAWKEALRAGRAKNGRIENRGRGKQGLTDDPARIVAAVELAERGLLTAPAVENRGRRRTVGRFVCRRVQGVQVFNFVSRKVRPSRKTMPRIVGTAARDAIVG